MEPTRETLKCSEVRPVFVPMDSVERAEVMFKHAPPEAVDDYARNQLRIAIQSYSRTAGTTLGRVAYQFQGSTFTDLHHLLAEAPSPVPLEIRFQAPDRSLPWDFDIPAHRLIIGAEGKGMLEYYPINRSKLNIWAEADLLFLERGMVRVVATRTFVPQSIDQVSSDPHAVKERLYAPRLLSMERLQEDLQSKGVVPLELAIYFYTREERFRLRISLVENVSLADFRSQKLTNRGEVPRSTLDLFSFDRLEAYLDLPDVPKRFFRVAFMLDTLRPEDLMVSFGVTKEIAVNNLNSLFTKGLLDRAGSSQTDPYSINMTKLHEFADKIPE